MWYDLNDVLSKNRLYSFIIGNRGGGKTFACQKWCIKDFITNGNKFIWLRRYGSEVDEIKGKWCSNALIQQFPNNLNLRQNQPSARRRGVDRRDQNGEFPRRNQVGDQRRRREKLLRREPRQRFPNLRRTALSGPVANRRRFDRR